MPSHAQNAHSYAGVEVVAVDETAVGGASLLSTGCCAVFELEMPRFWSSWANHFLVVLSSLRVVANMFSLSCSGRQVLSASRALIECVCTVDEGENPGS